MKCPNCRREMLRINYMNKVWYYECRNCGRTISKPTELIEQERREREKARKETND